MIHKGNFPWPAVALLSLVLAAASSCGSGKAGYLTSPRNMTVTGSRGVATATNASDPGGRHSFAFNTASISGFPSGEVFLTGGGDFDAGIGFLKTGGAFRCTKDINQGPLAGCKAGEGVRWDAYEILPSTGFKCTGSAQEPLKTAFTNDNTIVMKADFYRQGDGNVASFTANLIISAVDLDPDEDGLQSVWLQGVGCGVGIVNFH